LPKCSFPCARVILAAARSKSKSLIESRQAFQTALDLFRKVHDNNNGVRPNTFSYSYFLRACKALSPASDEQVKLVSKAFDLCRQNGLVSSEVVDLIPKGILKSCLESEAVNIDSTGSFELPKDWARNLPAKARVQPLNVDAARRAMAGRVQRRNLRVSN
jgi:hypothetical protein